MNRERSERKLGWRARCAAFLLCLLAAAPLTAETDFFGNPVTPRPAAPKPVLPVTPPPVVSRSATPAPKADPVAGDWHWFNDHIVKFSSDGRANSETAGPVTWTVSVDKGGARVYVLTWERGGFIDTLTLSADGAKLDGQNASGDRVWATRVIAPAAAPPIPAALKLATPVPVVKGVFHVSVDDGATIYVNGVRVHDAGVNESHSGPLELKIGDRVVCHLRNAGGVRRFEVLFATADGASVVSFRAIDFKIMPDNDLVDFTPAQMARWTKAPKAERRRPVLPIKSYSDNVWGDADECTLACIIAPKMFSQRPK